MNSKICLLLISFFLFSISVNAQLERLTEKIKEKVEQKVEEKIDEKIDESIDKTIDDAEEGLSNDDQNTEKEETKATSKKSKQTSVKKEESGDDAESGVPAAKKQQQLQSKSKFDFIPGDKIIFFDDFADVAIGDFPINWDTKSSAEVVSLNNYPGKWLQLKGSYSYYAPVIKNLKLPENFTIEFDAVCEESPDFSIEMFESKDNKVSNDYYPGKGGTLIAFEQSETVWRTWIETEDGFAEGNSPYNEIVDGSKNHFSIWGQKTRIRVYCNDAKVLDLPRCLNNVLKLNFLRFANYANHTMEISNVRVAVGSPDMRSRLITEGKFVTYGITFDSGSDKIKPESYAVLKEIADVLKDNPDVKVKIVGHTDSDGNDASNMTLSKKRSESVKKSLSGQFGINASRMTTDGKGESEPIAKNDTPQGKAGNRRVEFIKQ